MTILKHFAPKLIPIALFLFSGMALKGQNAAKEFYEIRTYKLKDKSQEDRVHAFLTYNFLPAAHKFGIKKIGVFTPLETDSTFGKRIVVLIPFSSLDQLSNLDDVLSATEAYDPRAKGYVDADYMKPPYDRIESVVLRAFTGLPKMELPPLDNLRADRIYELRSYEGPTEKIYKNKVRMFNEGDEVGLFKRLQFNAVFYAEVISGNRMPNLMYMTTFANRASRDAHWKAFVDDPQWKKLSSMPEYQHNVSTINIYLLRPTDYSDF
ncbi:MAG TPA: NIPSNAP family protein [Cyclobacteriaceae bacterium]|nr:NIPSNAP family protein [Cyclobacteriaceae bacterium]